MKCEIESIFSGESVIIPLAEVHHIERDKRSKFKDGLNVVLNGTTWNEEIDAYNNSVYLQGEEAKCFNAAWCRYRRELDFETVEIFPGTKESLGKLRL